MCFVVGKKGLHNTDKTTSATIKYFFNMPGLSEKNAVHALRHVILPVCLLFFFSRLLIWCFHVKTQPHRHHRFSMHLIVTLVAGLA